jgi:hypothetical protein
MAKVLTGSGPDLGGHLQDMGIPGDIEDPENS